MSDHALPWRSRIVGYGEEAPDQILAHPLNPRVHSSRQRETVSALVGEVGVVEPIIINQRSGFLVNGHLRAQLALSQDDPSPLAVTYIDCDEAEERFILATYDPVGALATTNRTKMAELVAQATTENADILAFLGRVKHDAGDGKDDDDGSILRVSKDDTLNPTVGDPLEIFAFGKLQVPVASHEVGPLVALFESYSEENEGSLVGFAAWLCAPSLADVPAEYFDGDEREDEEDADG